MKRMFVVSLASVFLFLVAIVFRSSRWKTICTASGAEGEKLLEQHAYLEALGFRCRLRMEEPHTDESAAEAGFGNSTVKSIAMILQVHEEDIKPAADALARYESSFAAART